MYFYYGIKNSTLEEGTDSDQNIELTVTDIEKPKFNEQQPQYAQTLDQNIYRYVRKPIISLHNTICTIENV